MVGSLSVELSHRIDIVASGLNLSLDLILVEESTQTDPTEYLTKDKKINTNIFHYVRKLGHFLNHKIVVQFLVYAKWDYSSFPNLDAQIPKFSECCKSLTNPVVPI